MIRPLLVVTAVEAERSAVLAGIQGSDSLVTVAVSGVGPAAAAAGTARLLALADAAGNPYRTVISAGIAGGYVGRAGLEAVVLARRSIQADLGADSADGFLPLDALGFGSAVVEADPELLAELRSYLPGAITGDLLTVSTVTGSSERAAALAGAHPDAVGEAMEGYGVGWAATATGAAFAELRTISNPVGPRNRSSWRIREALAALTTAAGAALSE